jgi:hypothetical protein
VFAGHAQPIKCLFEAHIAQVDGKGLVPEAVIEDNIDFRILGQRLEDGLEADIPGELQGDGLVAHSQLHGRLIQHLSRGRRLRLLLLLEQAPGFVQDEAVVGIVGQGLVVFSQGLIDLVVDGELPGFCPVEGGGRDPRPDQA